jgi:hypothetical protein
MLLFKVISHIVKVLGLGVWYFGVVNYSHPYMGAAIDPKIVHVYFKNLLIKVFLKHSKEPLEILYNTCKQGAVRSLCCNHQ